MSRKEHIKNVTEGKNNCISFLDINDDIKETVKVYSHLKRNKLERSKITWHEHLFWVPYTKKKDFFCHGRMSRKEK